MSNNPSSQFQPPSTVGPISNKGYSQSQPSFTTAPGPARLSLASRNINEFAESSRTLSNADNYFRQDHNRHQGIPLNESIPRSTVLPQRDPIGNLINNMLMPSRSSGPIPPSHQYFELGQLPEPTIFPQGNPTNRFSQLHPQRQRVTPAFNPSKSLHQPPSLSN
jgi:hypothetical protein